MRKIIALVMVLSICILSLVSCDILDDINIFNRTSRVKYPDGYTGGFTVNLNDKGTEIYWVETYEEAVEAIRLLKSHGSTFSSDSPAIFNYEGDLFDVKYCFKMDGEYGVDKQGIGTLGQLAVGGEARTACADDTVIRQKSSQISHVSVLLIVLNFETFNRQLRTAACR